MPERKKGPFEQSDSEQERDRVVIVDDDPMQLKLMQRALAGMSLEVVSIDSPIGAANAIANAAPRLVLINFAMPDGRELCELLKSHPRTRDVPLVFLSAQPPEELARACKETGADGFIEKGNGKDLFSEWVGPEGKG